MDSGCTASGRPLLSVPRLRMRGTMPPLPDMPSCLVQGKL